MDGQTDMVVKIVMQIGMKQKSVSTTSKIIRNGALVDENEHFSPEHLIIGLSLLQPLLQSLLAQ